MPFYRQQSARAFTISLPTLLYCHCFVLLGQSLCPESFCPACAIALSCLCMPISFWQYAGNLRQSKTLILTASFHVWMHQQDLSRFLLPNFQMFLHLKDHFPQTKSMLSYTPNLSTSKVLSQSLNHVWKWFDEVNLLCSVCFIYHPLFHLSSFHLSSIVSFGLLVSFCFLNPPSADHLGTIITKFTKPSKMLAKNAIFPKPFGLKKKAPHYSQTFPNFQGMFNTRHKEFEVKNQHVYACVCTHVYTHTPLCLISWAHKLGRSDNLSSTHKAVSLASASASQHSSIVSFNDRTACKTNN